MKYVNIRMGLFILMIFLLIKMLMELENIILFLLYLGLAIMVSYILKQKIDEKFLKPVIEEVNDGRTEKN